MRKSLRFRWLLAALLPLALGCSGDGDAPGGQSGASHGGMSGMGGHGGAMAGAAGMGGGSGADCMEYRAGLSLVGAEGWTVSIVEATPAPPQRGENLWELEIKTPSGVLPAEGITLELTPWMPAHNHGSALVTVEKLGSGHFAVSDLKFTMAGRWTVTVDVKNQDVTYDSVEFAFCVDME